MSAPTIFRSTDSSAPTLSGTAGDLINLLNKCLVVGYGSKSPLGWGSPYGPTGNKQVFRAATGLRHYLYVDDSGGGAGALEANMRGWETMGSITDTLNPETGTTGPFPTSSQLVSGIFIRKSATSTSTTRSWILIGDERTFYLFVQTGDNAGVYYATMFGEMYSYSTGGDSYASMLIGRNATGNSQAGTEVMCQIVVNGMASFTGQYLARSASGLGGAVTCCKIGASQFQASTSSGNVETLRGTVAYPNPPDGGLLIAPVEIGEIPPGTGNTSIRGKLRGFYHQCHSAASFTDGDTFSGVVGSAYDSKTFIIIKNSGQGLVAAAGAYVIETTAWDHN